MHAFYHFSFQKLQKLWQAQEKKHNEYLASLKEFDVAPKPEKVAKKEVGKQSGDGPSPRTTTMASTAPIVVDIPSSPLLTNVDGTIGTLYHFNDHYRTQLIRIVANCAGHKIKVVTDPIEFKSEQFLRAFPLGKLPAFLLPDGKSIEDERSVGASIIEVSDCLVNGQESNRGLA